MGEGCSALARRFSKPPRPASIRQVSIRHRPPGRKRQSSARTGEIGFVSRPPLRRRVRRNHCLTHDLPSDPGPIGFVSQSRFEVGGIHARRPTSLVVALPSRRGSCKPASTAGGIGFVLQNRSKNAGGAGPNHQPIGGGPRFIGHSRVLQKDRKIRSSSVAYTSYDYHCSASLELSANRDFFFRDPKGPTDIKRPSSRRWSSGGWTGV